MAKKKAAKVEKIAETIRLQANIHQVLSQKDMTTLTVKIPTPTEPILIPTGDVILDITKAQQSLDFGKADPDDESNEF